MTHMANLQTIKTGRSHSRLATVYSLAGGFRNDDLERILLWDQFDATCPAPFAKIFSFPSDANHFTILAIPSHTEGRFAIVTDVGRDAMDAGGAQ